MRYGSDGRLAIAQALQAKYPRNALGTLLAGLRGHWRYWC